MNNKFIYNNKTLRSRRKELRNRPTETEKILWNYLKNSKLCGLKFVRQYSTGPYILDFFCPKLRLAIELDGNQHKNKENFLYDQDRNKYLESIDIKTLRFWNSELVNNPKTVLKKILDQTLDCKTPY